MFSTGDLRTRFHRYYESSVRLTSGLGNICPTELNPFSMTNTTYRDIVCRPNGVALCGDKMAKHQLKFNSWLSILTPNLSCDLKNRLLIQSAMP